jgi:curved DNA-binding protein CbpA
MMCTGLRRAAPHSLMEGQLRDHPLVELIHEISGARLSGALRLAFERVKAVVYFESGQVVAAVSNLRALRLTQILLMVGALDAARLFSIAGEGASDDEAASALLGAGLLEESALRRVRERQTAEVLRDIMRRPEGEWNFDPRVRLAGERHTSTNLAQHLVEGARALAPEIVSRRMGNDGETLAPAPDASERLGSAGVLLSPAEGFVMSRVYEPTNLRYVIAVSGIPEDETRRAVYALALGGLITRERWPRAMPAYVPHQTAARPVANVPVAEPPQAESSAGEPVAQEASAQAGAEADPRELMKELLALALGETHYALLGVTRSSTTADVKRAYYSLARRLHPDRLRRAADADEQQRIDAAFAKIAQAYDVLKDSKLRASYDLKIEKMRSSSKGGDADAHQDSTHTDTPPRTEAPRANADASAGREDASATAGDAQSEQARNEEAEQKFRQGLAAYAKKEFAAARLLFGEAARLDPRRARYRAHFGRALARDKATRRQAETELLAAVSLDALDASYRVMLAELYRDVGLRRKAEAQLERAITLEPTNAEARALFEELRRADA